MAAWLGDCVVSLCNTYEKQAGSKYSTSFNYCVLIKNFQTSKLQELDQNMTFVPLRVVISWNFGKLLKNSRLFT